MSTFLESLVSKDKHIHKYQRFKTPNGKKLWKCMLTGCNHSFYNDDYLIGKESICWNCGSEFRILGNTGKLSVKPLCDECWTKRRVEWRENNPEKKAKKLRTKNDPNKKLYETLMKKGAVEEALKKKALEEKNAG